jgi:hypothetical protein
MNGASLPADRSAIQATPDHVDLAVHRGGPRFVAFATLMLSNVPAAVVHGS